MPTRPFPSLALPLQASSLADVLASSTGELYYFSGKHLYIKMTDPGAGCGLL